MLWSISLLLSVISAAGPSDFGRRELQQALDERGLTTYIEADVAISAKPDSFEIHGTGVTGGDRRGLMYGLIEAAEQIRAAGKLKPLRKTPWVAVRGVRMAIEDGTKK